MQGEISYTIYNTPFEVEIFTLSFFGNKNTHKGKEEGWGSNTKQTTNSNNKTIVTMATCSSYRV